MMFFVNTELSGEYWGDKKNIGWIDADLFASFGTCRVECQNDGDDGWCTKNN